MLRAWPTVLSLSLVLVLAACSRKKPATPEPSAPVVSRGAPHAGPTAVAPGEIEPLQPLPTLAEVHFDAKRLALGRRLFFEKRISGDGTVACASCHMLDHGGAEPSRTSTGIHGQIGPINAPTALNSGYQFKQFWDGRAADLREQAGGPITNPIEMGSSWDLTLAALRADPSYVDSFGAAYPDGITEANVRDAIAVYEGALVTPSPFNRYLRGDAGAISKQAREGYALFKSAGCTACHNGILVGGTSFQKLGVVHDYFADRGHPTPADLGRFNVTQREEDRHFFKVPTLRNIALTAPYFHDGSRATLADAVRAMGHYQLGRELSDAEVARLVAFLRTLTGQLPPWARPPA